MQGGRVANPPLHQVGPTENNHPLIPAFSRQGEKGPELQPLAYVPLILAFSRQGRRGRNYSHSRRYSTISARMAAVSKWPMSYLESRHASGAPASSYAALTSASIRSSPSCGVSES